MERLRCAAPWLWAEDGLRGNCWAMFRGELISDGSAVWATISADTKYYLYINGREAVFEGSLNRGPFPGAGYGDRVELTEHLRRGKNTVAALVWYWGNAGRNNLDSGTPGFYFETEGAPTPRFRARVNGAYGPGGPPLPSYLYGGHNIVYDARLDPGAFAAEDYDDGDWPMAVEVPGSPLYARPVPMIAVSGERAYEAVQQQGSRYVARLPRGAQITPIFTVRAPAGCRIHVRTDHYVTPGGPGDDHHVYTGHRVEYITREGVQRFEGLNWLYGERVIYRTDPRVEVISLGYRESGYDARDTVRFSSSCGALDRLVEKAQRTLHACMRDNYMDCPDRERGQWIGDVSVQAPQALMALDGNGARLMAKAIHDFIAHRREDRLVGNVPGIHCSELPAQSLCAISRLGMLEWYTQVTGDGSLLELAWPAMERYLLLWDTDGDGLVLPRRGNWYWFDHGEGVDGPVLENAWYYSALEEYVLAAGRLGRTPNGELAGRREPLKRAFARRFRHEDGYRSGECCDDRANAMAVLTGLAPREDYGTIAALLRTLRRATPYMEAFVLEALFAMGEGELAMERMLERYGPMAADGGSTLWEDFSVLGTRNHAWSGAPLTVALRHLAGLRPDGRGGWTAKPAVGLVERFTLTMQTERGEIGVAVEGTQVRLWGPVTPAEAGEGCGNVI